MNRTLRTIALAAPLATVTFSLGIGPALAEPASPGIDEITIAEVGPVNPDDHEPGPQPEPEQPGPQGPNDEKVSIPDPCPTHGPCGDTPDDEKVPNDEDEPGDDDSSTGDEIEKPTRIDAGAATSDTGTAGDELAWLLTGGVLIAMTGAAYAARRRERTSA